MKTDAQKLKKLVDGMDLKSESANAHDFVITHRALAVLMVKTIGVESTLKVFEAVEKESGGYGLPGLTGVAGCGPDKEYLARLGKSCNWGEWDF